MSPKPIPYGRGGSFFDLTANDLFDLACKQYSQFYRDQTPLNAYLVSVTLFHLLDWLAKNGSTWKGKEAIEAKAEEDRSAEEALVLRIHALDDFHAVVSAANNAKHRDLDGKHRPAYAKKMRQGAFAGVTRAGDSLGGQHLVLVVGDTKYGYGMPSATCYGNTGPTFVLVDLEIERSSLQGQRDCRPSSRRPVLVSAAHGGDQRLFCAAPFGGKLQSNAGILPACATR